MKFLLATGNIGKAKEFSQLLLPIGTDIVTPKELGIITMPEETGATFAENSKIKAYELHRITNLPTIADDSGICVDALGGEPGVFSARYGGEGLTDKDRAKLLLENMKDIPNEKRTARFVCSICCAIDKDTVLTAEGICEGKIGLEPKGENGFGYDPVFLVGDKSFSQISEDEKNKISHRGIASRLLVEKLEEYLQKQGDNT